MRMPRTQSSGGQKPQPSQSAAKGWATRPKDDDVEHSASAWASGLA
jgi:hypothetical protein